MYLEDSKTDFDGWSELTVIAALSHDDANFATLVGKSNHAGWMGNDSDLAWAIFTHRLDGGYNLWGSGIITDTPANYYGNNTGTKELQTQDGGSPGLLVFSYKTEGFVLKVNGVARINHTGLSGNIQEKPDLDVTIGGHSNGGGNNKMQISELLIFDRVLDDNELTLIEISLMDKWGIGLGGTLSLFDSNQSTFVFEDQSGGDRPMFFYGETQNNQNLFGSTLGFDGGSNFGKIDLLDRNQSTIEIADVTLFNLLNAWWPFDGDSLDYSGNERHGQMVGNGAFGMGRFDQALDLQNGGIFRVQEEKDPGIYENFPRTLSMWVKTLAPSGNLVKWGTLENGKYWNWSITSSNGMGGWMKLGIYGANQTGKHYMISDGKWRHLAVSMTPIGESSFSLNLLITLFQVITHNIHCKMMKYKPDKSFCYSWVTKFLRIFALLGLIQWLLLFLN